MIGSIIPIPPISFLNLTGTKVSDLGGSVVCLNNSTILSQDEAFNTGSTTIPKNDIVCWDQHMLAFVYSRKSMPKIRGCDIYFNTTKLNGMMNPPALISTHVCPITVIPPLFAKIKVSPLPGAAYIMLALTFNANFSEITEFVQP